MDSLFLKLVRVVNLTARPFQQRVGRQHQLKLNEWRVLAVIAAQPGVNATDVAEVTGLDKMSVSRSLAGLHRMKRVQRRDDPTDQRRSRLYPSAIGKALFATVSVQADAREAALFSCLDAVQRVQLDAMLDTLIVSVSSADA